MRRFTAEGITDAKRLARGEHLLRARTWLNERGIDRLAKPNILFLAGGAPEEEIGAIRSVWATARITAIDRIEECVQRATAAGADEALKVDLAELWPAPYRLSDDAWTLFGDAFDLVDLDFCGTLTEAVGAICRGVWQQLITYKPGRRRGALMVTFAYGRDVVEFHLRQARDGYRRTQPLVDQGVPESVAGRLHWLGMTLGGKAGLDSVILYAGRHTPMCATLWTWSGPWEAWDQVSVAKVNDCDLRDAIEHPDPALLYAVPKDRLLAWRRSAAARKAVITRTAQQAALLRTYEQTRLGRAGLIAELQVQADAPSDQPQLPKET